MNRPPTRFVACLCAGFFLSALHAEEAPVSTAARIIGPISDGSPPPPEAPKPKFILRSGDIRKSETQQRNGVTVTVREINPIALPASPIVQPPAPETIATDDSSSDHDSQDNELLMLGATIVKAPGLPTRSFVTLQQAGGIITICSSGDFSLLTPITTFAASDGKTHGLIFASSTVDPSEPGLPEIPGFPSGKATFLPITGTPDPASLIILQSLHDLLNTQHDRLAAALVGKELQRLQQEAQLKADAKKPREFVLSHWTLTAAQAASANRKGAAQ